MLTKKGLLNWSIWIGVLGGIYSGLYASSSLYQVGVMWMSFVSLPIYFNAGAKRTEYFEYVSSMIVGVFWGIIFLYFIGMVAGKGVPENISVGVVVGIATISCCAIHFILTANFLLNKVPIMFGAIACTFSQGGENIPYIMITLFLGITLALIMQEGVNLLNEDGSWKFLSKEKE